MLLDRDSRTERTTRLIGIEDNRNQLTLRALTERPRDLAHHLYVEHIERRPRERDPRHAIVDAKVNVLIRHFLFRARY